uniref:EF-hand domain-containing protein n=1 Tax=Quercus lobata TaxID=97700 RepID=A0A7N2M8U0_QUELO
MLESGISTDIWTSYAARLMLISVIPLLIVQIPQILNSILWRHIAVMIGLMASLLLFVSYSTYQDHLRKHSLGRLLRKNGEPDTEIIQKVFHIIDTNHDRHISDSELRAFIIGIQFEEFDLDHNAVEIKREHDLLDVGGTGSVKVEAVEKSKWASIEAVLLLLLGTIIAAAFADPLVDTIDNFADATSIPDFFVSFIVLPLTTSSRDTVSAIRLASQYKRKTASLSFSEIYATVTIHNVLSIPVFLALVYIRGLTRDFSSEVLVILIVSIVMGLLGSFRTHFPLWTSIPAILLYPFSLALIYVLHYYYGWS